VFWDYFLTHTKTDTVRREKDAVIGNGAVGTLAVEETACYAVAPELETVWKKRMRPGTTKNISIGEIRNIALSMCPDPAGKGETNFFAWCGDGGDTVFGDEDFEEMLQPDWGVLWDNAIAAALMVAFLLGAANAGSRIALLLYLSLFTAVLRSTTPPKHMALAALSAHATAVGATTIAAAFTLPQPGRGRPVALGQPNRQRSETPANRHRA
jgi:hypothetical protein